MAARCYPCDGQLRVKRVEKADLCGIAGNDVPLYDKGVEHCEGCVGSDPDADVEHDQGVGGEAVASVERRPCLQRGGSGAAFGAGGGYVIGVEGFGRSGIGGVLRNGLLEEKGVGRAELLVGNAGFYAEA